jgi:hypothetical protein
MTVDGGQRDTERLPKRDALTETHGQTNVSVMIEQSPRVEAVITEMEIKSSDRRVDLLSSSVGVKFDLASESGSGERYKKWDFSDPQRLFFGYSIRSFRERCNIMYALLFFMSLIRL